MDSSCVVDYCPSPQFAHLVGENFLYVFKGARSAPRADGATCPRESAT
jgi:hypothetical protein